MIRRRAAALGHRFAGWILRPEVPPLAGLALAATCGVILAQLLGNRCTPWVWSCAVAGAAMVFLRHLHWRALLLFFGLGYGLLHAVRVSELERIPHREAMLAGQQFEVAGTGIVDDAPRRRQAGGWRFPLRLESLDVGRGKSASGARVLVTLGSGGVTPAYGDRMAVRGQLSIPASPRNPGQFDVRGWLFRRGISAGIHVAGQGATTLARDQGNPLVALSLRSREWIQRRLTVGLEDDPATASVIAAMVLGTRSETPDEIENAFIGSGTMHVFAVSGLHVGLFAYLAWMVLKALGLRRPLAIGLIIPAIVFYAFVTGLRPSACRATIMAVIVLAAYLFDRVPSLANSLGAAALVILAADTLQLLQPGFQLSFVVLGAIVGIAPFLRRPLQRFARPDPFLPRSLLTAAQRVGYGIGKRVADVLSVSCAAWLGSALLMLHHFEISTPIAVIANCFLVPCAFAVLFTSGVSLALGGLAGDALGALCNNANWAITKVTVSLAALFAGMPGGGPAAWSKSGEPGDLRVTVLAMEQGGGSAHVSVSGGRQWLMDVGHQAEFGDTLMPYLDYRGADTLDAILLSHGDSSHISAASRVLQAVPPRVVVVSTQEYRSPAYRALKEGFNTESPPVQAVAAGREFDLGQGAILRILFPPDHLRPALADDQAIVAQIEHCGWKILFMHDAGFATEKWLLEHCRYLDSDVLVKGRHLSDYSGLAEFIDAVNPHAIVATHADFPGGEKMPAAWRAMVEARGVVLFDQAVTGAVEIDVTPGSLTLSAFAADIASAIRRPH